MDTDFVEHGSKPVMWFILHRCSINIAKGGLQLQQKQKRERKKERVADLSLEWAKVRKSPTNYIFF